MKKIHVLHVVHSFGIGGLENGIVNLANTINDERFRFSIVSFTPLMESKNRITNANVRCETIPKRDGNDLTLPFRLARFFRRSGIDIVHTHGWGTFLEGIMAAKVSGVPVLIHPPVDFGFTQYVGMREWGSGNRIQAESYLSNWGCEWTDVNITHWAEITPPTEEPK